MLSKRVIPILLLHQGELYKTRKFKSKTYIGDAINALRIFNEKEVDEIIILDIDTSKEDREINYNLIASLSSECFIPLCYGGGVKSVEDAHKLFSLGVEKISLNAALYYNADILSQLANRFGSQSIVCSIDIKKNVFGKYKAYNHSTGKLINQDITSLLIKYEALGAGEIHICYVDREGTRQGIDKSHIEHLANSINIPIIVNGGVGSVDDIDVVLNRTNVSAVSVGSFFTLKAPHNAPLISYLNRKEKEKIGIY